MNSLASSGSAKYVNEFTFRYAKPDVPEFNSIISVCMKLLYDIISTKKPEPIFLLPRFMGIRSKLNPVVLQQEKKAAVMPEEDYDARLAAAIKAAKRNGSARRQSK